MNFIKPNLKSLPEQVDINTNDIKNLKSIIKSSYKTEKELETTTITIPIMDTNAPQDTTSGWLYDSVGHLYSINGGDDTNLLLEYYTSFRGPSGIDGVPIAQTTGTSTESVMSQNAVTTELESKANIDAGNLSSENVTSWSNKLGIGTLTTELDSKANLDASNLSSENVTSWGNKLGIGTITTKLESKANIDASNLSSENVTSWANKLGCENVENVETIYDKDSNDANINWGYTSGIQNGTIVDKNFTKYKILRICYCNKNASIEDDSWGRNNIIELDLTKHINFDYSTTNQLRYITYAQNYNGGIIVRVNSEKTSFTVVITDDVNPSSNSFVYKIEGVY